MYVHVFSAVYGSLQPVYVVRRNVMKGIVVYLRTL